VPRQKRVVVLDGPGLGQLDEHETADSQHGYGYLLAGQAWLQPRWPARHAAGQYGLHTDERGWRELMFADTNQAAEATRDSVAPANCSASAQRKAASKLLDDEQPAHSFFTVISEQASVVRNTCCTPSAGADAPTFDVLTTATALRQRALALVQAIRT
jgi:hypothetical protein